MIYFDSAEEFVGREQESFSKLADIEAAIRVVVLKGNLRLRKN